MAIALVNSDAVGFADGNTGHLYTIPFGAPAVGDIDTLYLNSNTVISSVASTGGASWSLRVDATDQQGAYIYDRKATGGEPATVTVTTGGDFPTTLEISRISGADAFSAGGFTRANNSNNTVLPATTTGVLAATGMAVFAFAALHNFDGALATSPSWSNAFTALQSTSSGSAGSSAAVVGFTGYKLGVGTASETIDSVSWTNNARNRYAMWVAYAAAAGDATIAPTGIAVPVALGSPTLSGTLNTVPTGIAVTVALGSPTLLDAHTVTPAGIPIPAASGSPTLVEAGGQVIVPSGIPVTVALGSPTVAGPPGPASDQLLLPVAQELLACLCAALAAQPNPPGDCCIRAGDETIQDFGAFFDECCEGQAYVRIDGFYPTGGPDTPFPSPSSDFALSKCAPYAWGLSMEMGVFRCISTEHVSCDEWTQAAQLQMADAKAMRAALCCFMAPRYQGDVAVGTWTPKGREGGCIGSVWSITAMVLNRCEGC